MFVPAGLWEFPAGLGQRDCGEPEGESVPWGHGLGRRAWALRVPACALLGWELGGAASRGEREPREGALHLFLLLEDPAFLVRLIVQGPVPATGFLHPAPSPLQGGVETPTCGAPPCVLPGQRSHAKAHPDSTSSVRGAEP